LAYSAEESRDKNNDRGGDIGSGTGNAEMANENQTVRINDVESQDIAKYLLTLVTSLKQKMTDKAVRWLLLF